ncbi:MAG TPA: SRPBCC family protein [Planctomycetota bacterium]|nr:SRPBCC family protein [Planctomycetota bacterium]
MLLRFSLALVAIVVVLLVVIATRPATFQIQRAQTIAAPPAAVFAEVNDLAAWTAWSPWEQRDPALTRTYGATTAGVGATYHWRGNSDVGEGRMTITESRPAERIGIDIEFIKPFAARNRVAFDFAPAPAGATVTWTMSGEHNFMGKAFCLFMDMDAMVGGDFEKGLAQLKAVVEAKAR